MSCELYSRENNELYNIYEHTCKNNLPLLNKLKLINGEFHNYYSYNLRTNKLKFIFYFIKELFLYHTFSISLTKIEDNSKLLCICTSDYIYNDNIKPITEALNTNLYYDKIKLISKNKLGFSYKKNDFPLKLLLKKKIVLNFYNLILTLYLYLIIFPKLSRIENTISVYNFKKYKLILSADPCDIFSKLIYNYKYNSKYILIQNGPIFNGTPEWNSIFCDLVAGWELNKEFFIKENINYKLFFPPRFLYLKKLHNKILYKYHIVFFLPWLHDNSNINPLIISIKKAIIYTYNRYKKKVYVRYHPAGKINLKLSDEIISEIDLNISTKEILLCTKKTINLGSTISFDCIYLNKSFGILNFDIQINDDSIFFTSKLAKNIKTVDDLEAFLTEPENNTKHIINTNKNDDIISYITNELTNN